MVPLTTDAFETFTPKVYAGDKDPPLFYFSVPTELDRDTINLRLKMAGVAPVKPGYLKSALIDELYNLHPEEEADELALLVEQGWARVTVHNEVVLAWAEQERERRLDELNGAPPRAPVPQPATELSPRESAKLDLIVEETVSNSPRLMKIEAQSDQYDVEMRRMILRFHLIGWDRVGNVVRRATSDPQGGETVDIDSLLELRREIGERAWQELLQKAVELYSLSRGEVGNLDLPRAKRGPPNGSGAANADGDSSAGTSTKQKTATTPKKRSSTSRARTDGSPKTTAPSSGSSSSSEGRKASSSGRTVAASPSNR